jgi:hypothetical protein
MTTTKPQLIAWFDRGVERQATHMIVVCDTFNYEDYPVYVSPDQDAQTEAAKYNGANMQRIMEVYNLHLDRDQQMAEYRAFHY